MMTEIIVLDCRQWLLWNKKSVKKQWDVESRYTHIVEDYGACNME